VRRTLQLEGLTSLRAAIERAMAVKVIQENSFSRKQENYKGRDKFQKREKGNENWGLKKDFKLKSKREGMLAMRSPGAFSDRVSLT